MDRVRILSGLGMDRAWIMHGLSLDYVQILYGSCVDYLWTMHVLLYVFPSQPQTGLYSLVHAAFTSILDSSIHRLLSEQLNNTESRSNNSLILIYLIIFLRI